MKISQLRPYSIGTVAENKKISDGKGGFNMVVEITLPEDNAMLDGELDSGKEEEEVETQGADGSTTNIKVVSARTVKATWLPMGTTNRITAPDVRRGAEVIVYKFGDVDAYFWATLKDDMALRKLETVVYAWSGTKVEGAPISADNYYFLEVSTHKKVVHFHTSKANGEPFSYAIQINTDQGFIKIQDDAGNFFTFDSAERQIVMENTDGCSFDLDKLNLTITVPETYTLKAKHVVEEVGETIKTSAGSSISSDTKEHKVKATSLTEDATNVEIKGSATVNITGGAVSIN